MKCLAFRNLLSIEPAWGMISFLLILLILVLLCLISFLLILLKVSIEPANNVNSDNNDVKTILASENIDKGKSILGVPPKLEKKEAKNPRVKKGNNQKSKQKKQHLCQHY